MRASRPICAVTLALLLGCDESAPDRVIDVEGPRGVVTVAGPWAVDVVTRRDAGQLFVAVDGAAFMPVAVVRVADQWVRGELPAADVGARVAYYATVGSDRAPADGAYEFVVRAPPEPPEPPPPTTPCRLAWRAPAVDQTLTRADDNAPQAGIQTTVILDGVVPDHTAAVLTVGDRRYAARALGGLLVFGGVDVAPGEAAARVTATTPGGRACALEGTLRAR